MGKTINYLIRQHRQQLFFDLTSFFEKGERQAARRKIYHQEHVGLQLITITDNHYF